VRGLAAVDGDLGAGDERRGVRQQEGDERGDLVRLPGPAERGFRDGGAQERLGRRGRHRGLDETGVDRVHPDPGRAELHRGDLDETPQGPLARDVGDGVVRGQAGDGADVDDRPAVGHQRYEGLDAEQGTGEVDGQNPIQVHDAAAQAAAWATP
jgi:hypothetical protein